MTNRFRWSRISLLALWSATAAILAIESGRHTDDAAARLLAVVRGE
jgi:hypothetical protein